MRLSYVFLALLLAFPLTGIAASTFYAEGTRSTEAPQPPQTASSVHHGGSSHAQDAVSAAQVAGQMAKMLAVKGFLDYMQNREMQKALDNLGRKIEVIRNDVKTGTMTPAQYEAARAAINNAYERNAKVDLAPEKEFDKSGLNEPNHELVSFQSAEGMNKAPVQESSAFKNQSFGSDVAQLDPSKSAANSKSVEPGVGTERATSASSAGKENLNSAQMNGMLPLGAASGGGVVPNNEIHVHVGEANNLSSSDKEALRKKGAGASGYSQEEVDSDEWEGGGANPLVSHEGSGADGDWSLQSRYQGATLLTQGGEKYGSGTAWKKFLKPIKIQKNPFFSEF
ncbi:MAG: hypothetical protein EBZ49_14280 [Proteobacteria bacterium]|nr:hypothetical protein [Pseudomonadota bacterium]